MLESWSLVFTQERVVGLRSCCFLSLAGEEPCGGTGGDEPPTSSTAVATPWWGFGPISGDVWVPLPPAEKSPSAPRSTWTQENLSRVDCPSSEIYDPRWINDKWFREHVGTFADNFPKTKTLQGPLLKTVVITVPLVVALSPWCPRAWEMIWQKTPNIVLHFQVGWRNGKP